jgi:signal transduction histidine kinase
MDSFEKAQKELQLYHQRELQNSQKLATIGEMSARIAHEIRNPITGISQALEIIVADAKHSEHKPILEEIQRQANRVNQAISNMLKFSRSKDIFLEPGDVNEVIKSLVFFLEHQAHDKIVNITMDLQEDIPAIAFDHELVENVLLNLSYNAIQSIGENGQVNFTTQYDLSKKNVVISVKDNGSGIPAEIGKEIFKPFYTTRTKGTGLGLAISKDIIEKHKGNLWYKNNIDAGCTFFISLPV